MPPGDVRHRVGRTHRRAWRSALAALNRFLEDIYSEARIIADGVIPADMVRDCPQYRLEMRGFRAPHGVWVAVCGTDLVRTNDGFRVLEDNLRVPSGVSYMLAIRKATKSAHRLLYRLSGVRDIENYGLILAQTLRELAPEGRSDPTMALLTPGIYNSAFYEHMFLARQIGADLVEGRDLVVEDGYVYMRTTSGLKRVDVIYRRVDDDFLDPLVFRPDSLLGVPGLLHAARLGNVSLVNAPGTGVADDKSVYAFVPDMIRYYLGAEPLLDNVETYLCRRPDDLEYTLDNLEHLVVKRVGESGGYGMLIGPHSTAEERNEFAALLRADPADYISQPTLAPVPRAMPDRGTPGAAACRPAALHPDRDRDPDRARRLLQNRPAAREPGGQLQPGRGRQGLLGSGGLIPICCREAPRGCIGWADTWREPATCPGCSDSRPSRWWTARPGTSTSAGIASTGHWNENPSAAPSSSTTTSCSRWSTRSRWPTT